MASRRLAISSLLCDDRPPFSPLDALVHAATEERRRLDDRREPHRDPDAARDRQHYPPSIAHLISHDPPADQRPAKKPRFSPPPDTARIARDRDKMLVGELGYGRTDSPLPGPSHQPRRHPAPHGRVALADLLTTDAPPDHRVRSPPGRRSPPGSHIGRAKAARKSDDHLPPRDDLRVKQEQRPPSFVRSPILDLLSDDHRPRHDDQRPRLPPADEPRPRKPVSREHPQPQPKRQQDDAHEWFLQQFDEEPSPTTSAPPHTPSPSASPVLPLPAPLAPAKPSPPPLRSLTPVTAAVSLEEELEELVSDPLPSSTAAATSVTKRDPDIDMEVDLAVTELVDTLEADSHSVKHEPKRMEVDVEDELLSLLDDTPKPAPPPAHPPPLPRRIPSSSSSAATSASSHGSAPIPSATHSLSHGPPKQAPHQNQNRSTSEAPHVSPVLPTAAAAVSPVTARHNSTRPASERGSMPPPASTTVGNKKSTDSTPAPQPATSAAAKKKKDSKAAKSKNATVPAATPAPVAPLTKKPRPPAKSKKATPAETLSATPPASARAPKAPTAGSGPPRKTAPSASRSRSASVMPGRASVGPEGDTLKAEDEESDGAANEDDKLYCVCKTKYDEDRFMIACDRCDEWYHTQCVKMPDLEVDLVDQFICPLCIEKYPHLNLRTTYKTRCLYGLRHPDPSSTRACHKAARGAFSKYCSDDCGVKYMQSRVDNWAKKGGKPEKLWETVKGAEKREGVVCAVQPEDSDAEDVKPPVPNGVVTAEVKPKAEDEDNVKQSPKAAPPALQRSKYPQFKTRVVPPSKSKIARETERLNGLLDAVIKMREDIKRGMEIVVWRERLLQLATERAESIGQCGWDQRLCMDDDEWAEAAENVIESYDGAIARAEAVKQAADDGEMEVDGTDEQWWCPGKKVCDRHQGWQAVRHKDVSKEKEKKEEALAKLTTREREIRKRIEDMLDPHNQTNGSNGATHNGTKDAAAHGPLKSSNVKPSVNGHSKTKAAAASGDAQKKGKKRKAPAS